jgi:hypothetical protein
MTLSITVPIVSVTVLLRNHPDHISIKFEGPTPFPEIQEQNPETDYGPSFDIEVRKGYALEWLKLMGIPEGLIRVETSE